MHCGIEAEKKLQVHERTYSYLCAGGMWSDSQKYRTDDGNRQTAATENVAGTETALPFGTDADNSSAKADDAPKTDRSASGSEADENIAEDPPSGSGSLVAYFSLAGEQYAVGWIEKGNTEIIAEMIAERIGADLFKIEPVVLYPEDHEGQLEVSQREIKENARPAIVGTVENMDDYDTIYIGYPIWWGDLPLIVYNFLESYDFSGKTVIPFCTHGGSGLAGTVKTVTDLTGANTLRGLAVSGTTAQNDRDSSRSQVESWLRELGQIE